MTTTITLEQLASKINGKLWTKGDIQRVYVDYGFNTKKMTTKTYIYKKEDGTFGVSCYIDCPSQNYNWIKSQQEEVVQSVLAEIDNLLSDTVYIMVDQDNKIVSQFGKEIKLNHCNMILTEKEAKRELENCFYFKSYITMDRIEFEAKVAELDLLEPSINKTPTQTESSNRLDEYTSTVPVGLKYEHARFGIGISTAENEEKITINFEEHGSKTFLKQFAKLNLITDAN
jgi:hypothetical protein